MVFGIIIMLFLINPFNVSATPGFLRKDSIKECNGIKYGQHSSDNHWHVAVPNSKGGYNASGSPIYQDPCSDMNNNLDESYSNDYGNYNDTPVIIEKSSDLSLKSIKINDEEIAIKDEMNYETYAEEANIIVTPNDIKTTVEYNTSVKLDVGNNKVSITVTAEDSSRKIYILNIERLKELSSNNNAIIKIEGETINFRNGNSDLLTIPSSMDSLNIEYNLDDPNATIEIINNDDLKEGKNKITVRVTAENGDVKDYIINVDKNSALDENINGIIGVAVLGIIGFIIYLYVKKRKHNKS